MNYLTMTLGVLLLTTAGCGFSSPTASNTESIMATTTPPPANAVQENAEKINPPQRADRQNPLVWVGAISVEKGSATARENVVWSNEELNDVFASGEAAAPIKVDIMNCAGYIGSGEIFYRSKTEGIVPVWKVSMVSETIAGDAAEKVRRCSEEPGAERTATSGAFAVAPRNANRKNIKIGNVETRKLFASLPSDVRDFLNGKPAVAAGRRKSELSLLQNDLWTDTDGDGRTDSLYYSAAYDEEHSSGGILYLSGGQWTEIGSVRD